MFNIWLFVLEKIVKNFSYLMHPAKGKVTFFNKSGRSVEVKTYDQTDTVQWVAYQRINVESNSVVFLQARGTGYIHVYVEGISYTPKLGKAYEYDGRSLTEYEE